MNFQAETTSGEGIAYSARSVNMTDLPVILLTAWTHLEPRSDWSRRGRLPGKPWDDNKLLASVENLLELGESTQVSEFRGERRASPSVAAPLCLRGIVFASAAMGGSSNWRVRLRVPMHPC
jgi:hypothetical protein